MVFPPDLGMATFMMAYELYYIFLIKDWAGNKNRAYDLTIIITFLANIKRFTSVKRISV
jgi:hypothetical protein